jgi:hypothetical protein
MSSMDSSNRRLDWLPMASAAPRIGDDIMADRVIASRRMAMAVQKKLERGSKWNSVDSDEDGVVSDAEIEAEQSLVDLENKDKKEDQMRQMAWMAMLSMIMFTIMLFTPIIAVERLGAMDNILSMFYIAQAGVVASFFGSSAYMSRSL